MVDDVPASLNLLSEARPADGPPLRRRLQGRIPVPANERSAGRSTGPSGALEGSAARRAGGLLGRIERIGVLPAGTMQARSIFLQPEPDRLNRLAVVVALASALTGLTLLVSTTPH